MDAIFAVECLTCGRTAGHVVGGKFDPEPLAPQPVVRANRSVCGACGGALLLEQESETTYRLSRHRPLNQPVESHYLSR